LRRWLPLLLIILLVARSLPLAQRYVRWRACAPITNGRPTAAHLALPCSPRLIYVVVVALLPRGHRVTLAGGWMFGQCWERATVVRQPAGHAPLPRRPQFRRQPAPARGPWLRRLQEGFQADTNYLLFLRLVPLFPFFVVNLVPAVIGVPLRPRAGDRGIIPRPSSRHLRRGWQSGWRAMRDHVAMF
jgi:hypothetical protein